ncbi:hypothetical protein GTP81_04250 [Rugamonas sp. FT107W]|uniref:Uncharacterized protein n=1 Tax=Duganella vulcania TaxID=2692166 RepID=A0A845HEC7_9BURK|nr:hypothetical protein [Duganella vulcania]MYN15955.1 hypothetical protein [Duganella vulcania]
MKNNFKSRLLYAVCVIAMAGNAVSAPAEGTGKPFAVVGEQLQHKIPKGWKLAWMEGQPDGEYFVEYLPEAEDINNWREGYLSIRRLPYPNATAMAQIEKAGAKVADVALFQFIKGAVQSCGGRHQAMSQRTDTSNGVYLAVSGGYCDKYGSAAPFGEGSLIAYAQGKDYVFQIQYGWRPKSETDQKTNLPWHIAPETARQYMEAIKASSLCGGGGQAACPPIAGAKE